MTFSWRLESKRTRGKSNHKFRALAENEEPENFDGVEAVPNPESQQILNAEPLLEADNDPGNNLTIALCFLKLVVSANGMPLVIIYNSCHLIFNCHTFMCIILLTESMIEAANALNEVIVTYEPQGPNEVLELQQIPKIPEVEPLSQQDANPGKIYYYKKN